MMQCNSRLPEANSTSSLNTKGNLVPAQQQLLLTSDPEFISPVCSFIRRRSPPILNTVIPNIFVRPVLVMT